MFPLMGNIIQHTLTSINSATKWEKDANVLNLTQAAGEYLHGVGASSVSKQGIGPVGGGMRARGLDRAPHFHGVLRGGGAGGLETAVEAAEPELRAPILAAPLACEIRNKATKAFPAKSGSLKLSPTWRASLLLLPRRSRSLRCVEVGMSLDMGPQGAIPRLSPGNPRWCVSGKRILRKCGNLPDGGRACG